MTDISVQLRSTVDGCLFAGKAVTVDGRSVETPAKTVPVADLEPGEALVDVGQRIVELHLTSTEAELAAARTGDDARFVERLTDGLAQARADDFTVVLVTFEAVGLVDRRTLETLVNLLDQHADLLVTPLFTPVCRELEPGTDSGAETVARLVEFTEQFLSVVEACDVSTPVMGSLPLLGDEYLTDLLEVYLAADVDAFCVDFLGRKPTAYRRITGEVSSLMHTVGQRGLREDALLYAVNAFRGRSNDANRWPAADLLALGLGFDVLGGYHIPPDYPPEVWEMIRDSDDVRLFDRQAYEYHYVNVADLPTAFPDRSGFTALAFARLARDDDHVGRAQRLVAAEQMRLALSDFRDAIAAGRASDLL